MSLRKSRDAALTLDMFPKRTEIVSPAKYLDLLEKHKGGIKSVEFVAPKLGDGHFGYFKIDWKTPRFAMRDW